MTIDNTVIDQVEEYLSSDDSELEYETDDEPTEKEHKEIMRKESLDMADGFVGGAYRQLVQKYDKTIYNDNDIKPVNSISIALDSARVIDMNVADMGEEFETVYKLSVKLVPVDYSLNIDKYKSLKVINQLYECFSKLIEAIYVIHNTLDVQTINTRFKDIHFEQQTHTFYFHYNDQYRIGIIIEEQSLDEFQKEDHIYDSNLQTIKKK